MKILLPAEHSESRRKTSRRQQKLNVSGAPRNSSRQMNSFTSLMAIDNDNKVGITRRQLNDLSDYASIIQASGDFNSKAACFKVNQNICRITCGAQNVHLT